jgi:hypothetical protein
MEMDEGRVCGVCGMAIKEVHVEEVAEDEATVRRERYFACPGGCVQDQPSSPVS